MKLGRRMFKSVKCIVGIIAIVVLRTAIVPVLHAAEMKPEEIVARHGFHRHGGSPSPRQVANRTGNIPL